MSAPWHRSCLASPPSAAIGQAARSRRRASTRPLDERIDSRPPEKGGYSFTRDMKKSRRSAPCAVTIAMSDSGGGAGIQADLLTFAAHGIHAATVLVAVTAQNTERLAGVEPISAAFVRRQMDAVFPDFKPAAVKIGALYDAARIRAVAAGLQRHRAKNVVLDPVLTAKTGNGLLAPAAIRNLLEDLLPLRDLVMPNIPAAQTLSGARIRNGSDAREAALLLASRGCRAVLVKGGHARGETVTDLLYD